MCHSVGVKVHKSTPELVSLLADTRGLIVENRERASRILKSTSYYRFTGYARYFQVNPKAGDDSYVAGASFDEIYRLMLLDDELRMRLFVVLTEIEQRVRTRFAHLSSRELGGAAFYLDPASHISDSEETHKRIARMSSELKESKSASVAHYRRGDDVSLVPIWVAVQELSFGKVSWLVESIDSDVARTELADHFSFEHAPFPRVLHALSGLRNVCAHHGQLWHRYLTLQCPLPLNKRLRPRDLRYDDQGLYPAVIALNRLANSKVSRTHLAVIERRLRAPGLYGGGVLMPSGVR